MNSRKNKKKFNGEEKPQFKVKKKVVAEKEEIEKLDNLKSKLSELDPSEISSFKMLPLSEKTLKGLLKNSFLEPTKVQRQTLVHSLRGLDVVAAAKTGSGKTLAFVIPLLEFLYSKLWNHMDGLGALIITPTRELAYQIFEVINKVGRNHNFSVGLVIGGKDLKFEWSRISSCNILICTPGRLLQHMTENPDFNCDNVQILILDEADQCLSMGFADTMNLILEELPSERQTLLFSATQTRDVKDLIRAGCKDPIFCSVHEHSKTTTPKTLKESYIVCNDYDKITFLWSFLKHHRTHKILVFLATCKQVKFLYNLFTSLRAGLVVMGLHGDMHQLRRMAIYDEFCKKKRALLFATDVAARGLDIPAVDWVIQMDCPEDVTTYIHRAGRTARYAMSGEALLVLTPAQEEVMVAHLKMKNIPIEKIDVKGSKLHSIQQKVELTLSKNLSLKEDAERAFKAYLKNIAHMKNRKVFDISAIDLDMLARSFGLTVTPRVRFIERHLKKHPPKGGSARTILDPKVKTLKTFNLGLNQDEDDASDDDFLVQSEVQPPAEEEDKPQQDILSDLTLFTRKDKAFISKYELAKKAMKNNIQVNKRIVFEEDEDEDLERENQKEGKDALEAAADDHKASGINISEMQEIMKEQDKVDKKLHSQRLKEKKRKEKEKLKRERKLAEELRKREKESEGKVKEDEGFDEEEDGGDTDDDFTKSIIDALPDPDDRIGVKGERSPMGSENEGSSEDESETDISSSVASEDKMEKPLKRSNKRKAPQEEAKKKRMRAAAENDLSNIAFDEKEDLALFLLKGGSSSR